MSQSSSEIGCDQPTTKSQGDPMTDLPKFTNPDSSRNSGRGSKNEFQALNNLLGKSDKNIKCTQSFLGTSGLSKSLTPKMESRDCKFFRPDPERVDQYLSEMKNPNSARSKGIGLPPSSNPNLASLMPYLQMGCLKKQALLPWSTPINNWTQPLNAAPTPCLGQGATQNLLMQQIMMAKLNQQVLLQSNVFRAPQPVQKKSCDFLQGANFQINGEEQKYKIPETSPNLLKLVKNMGLSSSFNLAPAKNNEKSPALSNISVDGSNHNYQGRMSFDLGNQGARDRTMSSHTSLSSAQSRGLSCYSSGGSMQGSTLTAEERRQRVLKYWEKKKQRMNKNHVRYSCRKDLAENRFRYHGRFISKEQMDKILDNKGSLDEIYNPKTKCTPKTKQIFKVEKFQRSTSCCSNQCPSRKYSDEDEIMNIENDEIGNGFSENYNHLRLFGGQTQSMNLMAGFPNQQVSNNENPLMSASNIGPLEFNQTQQELLVNNNNMIINPNGQNIDFEPNKYNFEDHQDHNCNF